MEGLLSTGPTPSSSYATLVGYVARWGVCYYSYRVGIFLADFGHSVIPGHSTMKESCIIYQKYPLAVTVVAQPPLWLHSSLRWHVKDNGRSYLFQKMNFLILCIVGVLD